MKILAILALCFLPSATLANDSMVRITAGGLVLERTDEIRMVSEDLRISRHLVSVDYVFENLTDEAITATIGFPLPPYVEGDYDFEVHQVNLAEPMVPFGTRIDGASQSPGTHMRVTTSNNLDLTALLSDLGLLPTSYADIPSDDDLEPHAEAIEAIGASVTPRNWIYEMTYTWTLAMPPNGRVGVHHEYVPMVGGYGISASELTQPSHSQHTVLTNNYCATKAQIDSMVEWTQREGSSFIIDVGYVLTTGANWAGPIGDFHLTIESEQPDIFPMLCWAAGKFEQTSPTTISFEATDFTPSQEISIAFFMYIPL